MTGKKYKYDTNGKPHTRTDERHDSLLTAHDLDPPGDFTGFSELLRLVFDDDDAGRAIFASFDEKLLKTLWEIYQKRPSE